MKEMTMREAVADYDKGTRRPPIKGGEDYNYRGEDYSCYRCRDDRPKLWRDYGYSWPLYCLPCLKLERAAHIAEHKDIGGKDEDNLQIGGFRPAYPNKEGDSFWSAIPLEAFEWWLARPTFADDASADRDWYRHWARLWNRKLDYYSGQFLDLVPYKDLSMRWEELNRDMSKMMRNMYGSGDKYWEEQHEKVRARILDLVERRERSEVFAVERQARIDSE